jgi:hypothetical protein
MTKLRSAPTGRRAFAVDSGAARRYSGTKMMLARGVVRRPLDRSACGLTPVGRDKRMFRGAREENRECLSGSVEIRCSGRSRTATRPFAGRTRAWQVHTMLKAAVRRDAPRDTLTHDICPATNVRLPRSMVRIEATPRIKFLLKILLTTGNFATAAQSFRRLTWGGRQVAAEQN